MKPTFIGLGGQKCASSWLYRIFDDHPDAYVSSPKELNYFSAFYDRGQQWYERHFVASVGRLAIGEISPSYLPDRDAPARARAYNPGFRLLVALRDPVERAYSNHLHDLRLGYLGDDDRSFEKGLANNPMYVEQSRYAKHLRSWFAHFPREHCLVVLQEDIAHDPMGQARRVYEFLGIKADHVPSSIGQRANESYLPRSRERERLIRAAGATARRVGLGWLDRILRQSGLVSALHRRNRIDIRSVVPPMTDATREELYELLSADTLQLAELLGRQSLPWKTWEFAASRQAGRVPARTG